MAQRIQALAPQPNDPASILGTHVEEGENRLPQVFLCPLHVGHGGHLLQIYFLECKMKFCPFFFKV